MLSRLLKRIIILFVFIIILGLIYYGYVFLTFPTPTCTDGIKNGTEEGVDCGLLACNKSCEEEVASPEILSTKLVPVGESDYDFVAEIKNPHQDIGSSEVVFELVLFNSSDGEVFKRTGFFYLLPGQTRFLILSALPAGTAARSDLKIKSVLWQKLESINGANFLIPMKEYRVGPSGISSVLSGIVLNDSDFDFGIVDIDIALLDESGRIIGVNKTDVRSLKAHEERYFESNWLFPVNGQVKDTYIRAYTNLFENFNFIKQYGSDQEKFQQY